MTDGDSKYHPAREAAAPEPPTKDPLIRHQQLISQNIDLHLNILIISEACELTVGFCSDVSVTDRYKNVTDQIKTLTCAHLPCNGLA